MLTLVEVFGRMFILGGITATNVSALQAKSQVDPRVSHFDAFFADVLVRGFDLYLVEMGACSGHRFVLALIVHQNEFAELSSNKDAFGPTHPRADPVAG
jgi:hypothetical protein